MTELQTIDEMRAAHDGEWVLIVDCEYEDHVLVRGRVGARAAKKSEIHREMVRFKGKSGAIRFFGRFPADLRFCL